MSGSSAAAPAQDPLNFDNTPVTGFDSDAELVFNGPTPLRQGWYFGYGLTVAAVIAATILRGVLSSLVTRELFVCYFPAIVLVSVVSGRWFGMATTVLSALCATFLFLHPLGIAALAQRGNVTDLLLFLASGCGISLMVGALQAREDELNAVFEASPAAMAVIEANFLYRRVNRALARPHNLKVHQYRGKSIRQIVPQMAPTFEPIISRVVETGQPLIGQELKSEAPDQHGVTAYWHASYFPLMLRGSRARKVGMVVFETTQMKRLEETLRQRESHLKSAQRLAHIGNWRWDVTADQITWSDEAFRILGVEPENRAFRFNEHKQIWTPASWARLTAAVTLVLETGVAYAEELEVMHGTDIRTVVITGQSEMNGSGNVLLLKGTIQDVTYRKNAERISESLAEKEVLLKEIHHRVKNNLQIVSSLLRMQGRRIADKKVKEIFRESQNRILAMAAIHESLYQASSFSHVDLKQYLSRVVESVAASYDLAETKLFFENGPTVTVGMTSALPCGLIVNELISNALKHAFCGAVTLSVRREQGAVKLMIADDGVGLPEPFETLGRDSMGLELVRSLVQRQLNGQIYACSRSGTRFDIEFGDPQ